MLFKLLKVIRGSAKKRSAPREEGALAQVERRLAQAAEPPPWLVEGNKSEAKARSSASLVTSGGV